MRGLGSRLSAAGDGAGAGAGAGRSPGGRLQPLPQGTAQGIGACLQPPADLCDRPLPRNSCAKELTSFAAEAIAVNRQLAQREEDAAAAEEGQGPPVLIRAISRCLQLSPPAQSKLAQRRQRASLSAAPVVLVGDHA